MLFCYLRRNVEASRHTHFVVVSRHQQTPPRLHSVIDLRWSVAADCIALVCRCTRCSMHLVAFKVFSIWFPSLSFVYCMQLALENDRRSYRCRQSVRARPYRSVSTCMRASLRQRRGCGEVESERGSHATLSAVQTSIQHSSIVNLAYVYRCLRL